MYKRQSKDLVKKNLIRAVVVPSAMRMARETGLQVSQEVLQELGGHYLEANIRRTANSLRGTNFEIDEGEWKRVLGETLDKSILGALAFVTPTASINFGLELKSYKEGRARFEHLPGGKEFFTLLDKDATAGTFDTVIENSSHKLNDRVKINIGDLPEDIRVKIEKGELSKTDLNEYNLEDSKIEKLLNLSSDFKDHIEAGKFRSNVLEQSGTKLNAEQELFKNNLEVSKKIALNQRNLAQTERKLKRNSKEAHPSHSLGDRIQHYVERENYLSEWVVELEEEMRTVKGKDKIPYSDIIQENNTLIKENLERREEAIQKIRGRKKGNVDVVQEYTSTDPELGSVNVTKQ